jgi:hypothetical protein
MALQNLGKGVADISASLVGVEDLKYSEKIGILLCPYPEALKRGFG